MFNVYLVNFVVQLFAKLDPFVILNFKCQKKLFALWILLGFFLDWNFKQTFLYVTVKPHVSRNNIGL